MFELKKIAPATYELSKSGKMLVPGLVIATPDLLQEIDRPLDQVRNVACLPGIVGYSIAMPDIHWGYGFPIGGVAAMDAETGVISPGGVGYDINCGVRLALLEEPFAEFNENTKQELLREIFNQVPSGVGRGQKSEKRQISDGDYKKIVEMGARWSIEQGYGLPEDLEHMESYGRIEGADFGAISPMARERGSKQLGSIGSGNHFVEIGAVDRVFLPETANEWGVRMGMTYVLIHSGSRGFGHQICQDTLDEFLKKGYAEGLPDRQLVCAPIKSPEGEKYFRAMAGAANYAFNNRQQILSGVRAAFQTVCRIPPKKVRLLYDVCHNIAKFEIHEGKRLCVHRKGATRAFGKVRKNCLCSSRIPGSPCWCPAIWAGLATSWPDWAIPGPGAAPAMEPVGPGAVSNRWRHGKEKTLRLKC